MNKKGTYEGLCYGAYSVDKKYKNSIGISAKKIVKHNPNLTKVLETGDIIEHKIYQEIFKSEIYITNNDEIFTTDGERILPEEIISVVTHEQFNQVKYEV